MLEGATRRTARRGREGQAGRAAPRRGQVMAQNASLVVAATLLVAMLVLYIVLYMGSLSAFPGTFEAASITDHAVPLSLAAVGQSLVILTRGIDLSVGGMMDLTNSLAALKLSGGLATEALWTVIILLVGAAGGLLNGVLVAFGRIQPILVTLGTLSIFQGLALWVLPTPGGHVANGYTSLFLNPNAPTALIFVVLLALGLGGVPAHAARRADLRRRQRRGGGPGELGAGGEDEGDRVRAVRDAGGGGGNRARDDDHRWRLHRRRRVHAVLDRGGGGRRRVAVRRPRQRGRGDLRRVRTHRCSSTSCSSRTSTRCSSPSTRGCSSWSRSAATTLLGRVLVRREMSSTTQTPPAPEPAAHRAQSRSPEDPLRVRRRDRAVRDRRHPQARASPAGAGSSRSSRSRRSSGLVAAGQTFVILIGGIDLSVPWVLNGAAILMVAVANGSDGRLALGIVVALAFGIACGVVNGTGIALLGVPAGGHDARHERDHPGPCARRHPRADLRGLHKAAADRADQRHDWQDARTSTPACLIWLVVIVIVSLTLSFTTFGRRVYAVGNSRARVSPGGCQCQARDDRAVRAERPVRRDRGNRARRVRRRRDDRHGRPLPVRVDRRRGDRRYATSSAAAAATSEPWRERSCSPRW